ncbi:MAG TPA: DUF348 domain-containing protein [Clostridia bacterium]|nr:DUF348 domain-containing protein [Clostridia bacterium]
MSLFIKRKMAGHWLIVWQKRLVLGLVLGAMLSVFAGALKTVEIIDGEKRIKVTTLAFTVDGVLRQANLEYAPYDLVIPAPDQLLKHGMTIEVVRAEDVTIIADGKTWTVKAAKPQAHQVLRAAGVELGELDRVDYGYREDGSRYIKVTRITEEVIEERVELPFNTFRQPSNQLPAGQRRVLQPGKNGILLNKVKVVKADGVEISREVVSSRLVAEPKTMVVAYGIGGSPTTAARHLPWKVKKVMTMEATAYTHTGNPTATGIYPYRGIVAVDPKVIPLGSKLYVEGYGYCEAQDTGGAIKGDRIDIFLDTKEECFQWGRRIVQVYLLE